jgi:polar amino acid transport system substrate-binding protein
VKYWICGALAEMLAAGFLLTACGGGNGAGNGAAVEAGAVHLVNPGKLMVCTNLPYEPFQFTKDKEVVGFDVDIVNLAAKRLGVTQEIVNIDFAVIKSGAALNSGKCDLAAAGMTITDERKKNIDFSIPYFEATQALLARKGSGVTSLADVKAKKLKLAALAGTTGLDYVVKAGFDPLQFADAAKQLLSMQTGQTDVLIQDLPVVLTWLKKPEIAAKFELVANLNTGEQYGIAMKLGNSALGKVVNEAIENAQKDGSYDEIYRKWFGVPAPAKP